MNPPPPPRPRILVVDDMPQNLQLLENLLGAEGFQVFALPDGEMAVKAVARDRPDLVLLDIIMPGTDGYEVCTRLKADPALREIPVIFLSALDEPWDKVRAFRAGGVDYITKPFQIDEVLARVRTHLELSRQKRELQSSYQRLQEFEQLRENLTRLIVHDLRAPLTVINLSLDLATSQLPSLPENATLVTTLATAQRNVQQLAEMVTQMLDISRLEAGHMPLRRLPGDLVGLVHSVHQSLGALARERRLLLPISSPVLASYDTDLIGRVLANLLVNAFKFTPPDAEVAVQVEATAGAVRVAVTDNGPGIPPESHQLIFEKYGQLEHRSARQGTGLGLTFCRLAVEAHNGQIGVTSAAGQGATFWFTLPVEAI